MSVNGVTGYSAAYSTYETTTKASSTQATESTAAESTAAASTADSGVVYESSQATSTDSTKQIYTQNTALVNKLKADAESRTAQLQSLVQQLLQGQGNALGTADDMWSFLRTGNFTVDAATKAQAQADIADDGYWGVEQTSDRILDFAKALSGGDPDKIEEMREAFEKGFKQAQKTWGGQLPDISQRTYEATMKKFDEWASSATSSTTQTEA
jgi:hypothetical protein